MKNILKLLCITLPFLFLSACTNDLSPNTYNTDSVGQASRVEPGVIVSMRNVKIDQNTDMGGLAGAGAGAAAGSAIGGSGEANIIGAIGGAVIGGLAGNYAEKHINKENGVEYIVKLKNGSVTSITQPPNLNLHVDQRVLIIYGKTVRIIPDHTAPGTWEDDAAVKKDGAEQHDADTSADADAAAK